MSDKSIAIPTDQPSKTELRNAIYIKGARANNLKNVDLAIPKNKLVVVTGVSGSGKSSITMDTLYAEGQRRYVESLSSYARQFLMRMKKPDVDYIKGICPAIAIEQKTTTANARSTVGTLTEIYDFFRLLYARIGKTISPVSGEEVKKHEVSDVVDYIHQFEAGKRGQLFIPLPYKYKDRQLGQELQLLLQKGYTRLRHEGELIRIEDFIEEHPKWQQQKLSEARSMDLLVLIDRFVVREEEDEENLRRISDSVQTAFYESEGECIVEMEGEEQHPFNNRFELDGMTFPEPSPHLFNFNNPYGACPKCEGFSQVMGIDERKVVPNPTLSVYEGAIACWKGEKYGLWLEKFLKAAHHFDFPVHTPYQDLSREEVRLLWRGNKYFDGIHAFFSELEEKTYKIQNRVMLARYRGKTLCPVCEGGRLREEATYVKVGGKAISELTLMPVDELLAFVEDLELSEFEAKVGKRLLLEITNRLRFMCDVGLSYLTIGRISATLSGGETQRINLTRTLGSNLTSSMYILDEPSVGLHPRDTNRLVEVLQSLKKLGNTVIVVEHEEDVIKSADYLIDIGPEAGIHGGEVVFAGPYEDIYDEATESLTTKYMNGRMNIPVPEVRRKFVRELRLEGARQHNLKNIDVTFPLNTLTVVSGVSGSGKTTLVKQILYPALMKHFGQNYSKSPGTYKDLAGDLDALTGVEMINQSPIGKSSRSNPVTYVKAYDAIRNLMASQQLSKIRGYKPSHFSFNVDGGRCDTCKGEGEQVIEMQFLADVRLECEECGGKRFKGEVLEVKYRDKSIFDILDMSVEEAIDFFDEAPDVINKLKPLHDVGLGYVKLGQSSSTLSGGEAQRVKLASFLNKDSASDHIFFIFDEPTTGLHFHDIRKLLGALNALVEKGHSVLVVEHNMEVIKSADWVIDLGPEGGKNGGHLVFQGRPEELIKVEESYTGKFLQEKL
ncbi:excinuclease ABC subunit UvrA [Flavilitoribacter nigricans]|uniref:UvrABC system protein A n=1 Tax=Flavilitoribacter nigricans (strain ATCC 23147 / DSM 23189 / NBRC 102662 / NCIMB 1420 / SS-2) TaxID=1122177 RepID=A0A2D0N3A3_FLAN2|nr:excinuclease ABC subunit UvrA [Flavilitoribacter nigricans]PHN02868.1 excinuclease ABC subunit A [Flavilitoribacter nigricans DSM 23189 = NBRC 102662]